MSAQHWTTSAAGTSPGPLRSLGFLVGLGLWMDLCVSRYNYRLADLGFAA